MVSEAVHPFNYQNNTAQCPWNTKRFSFQHPDGSLQDSDWSVKFYNGCLWDLFFFSCCKSSDRIFCSKHDLTKSHSSYYYLWLIDLLLWFKVDFRFKIWNILPREMKKIILCEIKFNLHEMRLNIRKLGKLRKLESWFFMSFLMLGSIWPRVS